MKRFGITKVVLGNDEVFKPFSLGMINCFFVKSYLTQDCKKEKQAHENKIKRMLKYAMNI